MIYPKNSVLITGQARPIKEDVINNVFQTLSLGLVIDRDTDIIIDANITAVMDVTRNFIRDILIGKNFVTEFEDINNEIRDRFHGLIQKPLIVSLKDARNRYRMILLK